MAQAILLAGGKGTRLQPFAASFPKPLVPLGDKPVLEILIHRLRSHGFDRLILAVGHLAPLIQAYFQDGRRFGVDIEYSLEREPLGTAGPLALIGNLEDRFLVMNGDLLTDLDFDALLASHEASRAPITVARYRRDVRIDLGVIEVDDANRLTSYTEKPTLHYDVSMGAYVIERDIVHRFIERGAYADMPDLIRRVAATGQPVHTMLHAGFWLDIGRPEDYAHAQKLYESDPTLFLGDPG